MLGLVCPGDGKLTWWKGAPDRRAAPHVHSKLLHLLDQRTTPAELRIGRARIHKAMRPGELFEILSTEAWSFIDERDLGAAERCASRG
jgi:hypothetical protein